jgi:hypothetical protein
MGFDTGYFAAPHIFDALDQWKGTDKEPRFGLICVGSGTWHEGKAQWYADEVHRKGMFFGAWAFMFAHLSVKDQVATWLKDSPRGELPFSVDYENASKKYNYSIPTASQLLEAFDRVEQAEGRSCIGYSRKNVMDKYLATMSTEDLNKRHWWIAQYLAAILHREDPGPVRLPNRLQRDRIIIHQTSGDVLPPPPGFTPVAKAMDHDRWVGTMSLEAFVGALPFPVPIPAPATLEIEQRVTALEALHPGGAH